MREKRPRKPNDAERRAELRRIRGMVSASEQALAFARLMQACHGLPEDYEIALGLPPSRMKRRRIERSPSEVRRVPIVWRPGERPLWAVSGGPDVEIHEVYWNWRDKFSDRHCWYALRNFNAEVEAFGRGEGFIAQIEEIFARL